MNLMVENDIMKFIGYEMHVWIMYREWLVMVDGLLTYGCIMLTKMRCVHGELSILIHLIYIAVVNRRLM